DFHVTGVQTCALPISMLALILTIAMLSLAGVPLTAGFMGKFMMFNNVMGSYHVTLLILAAINAAIGVYYYLHVVVNMYFRKPEEEAVPQQVPMTYKVVLALAAILTLVVGIYPDSILGFSF